VTRSAWLVVSLVVLMVAALAGSAWRITTLQRQLAEREVSSAHAASDSARRVVDTIEVQVVKAGQVLTRTIHDVRVDTLMLAPVTHEDTLTAVRQLGALAIKHDSLQRKCSAFEVTCDEFRLAAAHRDTAQQHEITTLRDAAQHTQPGRMRAAWERIDQWVALGGGICLGAVLSGHRCLP
jgi:hypothetical protein